MPSLSSSLSSFSNHNCDEIMHQKPIRFMISIRGGVNRHAVYNSLKEE